MEARAPHAANSGVYFHTRYQESNYPQKGFEVQICNSLTGRESYQPRVMTGSLYGLRNIYKPFAVDDQWFKLNVAVRGKNIQVRLDGTLLVDYTEPTPPIIPDGMERERLLDHGTFALQCHDQGSPMWFRSVRVRLSSTVPSTGAEPWCNRKRSLQSDSTPPRELSRYSRTSDWPGKRKRRRSSVCEPKSMRTPPPASVLLMFPSVAAGQP